MKFALNPMMVMSDMACIARTTVKVAPRAPMFTFAIAEFRGRGAGLKKVEQSSSDGVGLVGICSGGLDGSEDADGGVSVESEKDAAVIFLGFEIGSLDCRIESVGP